MDKKRPTAHLSIVFNVADMRTVTHLKRIVWSSVEIDVVDAIRPVVVPSQTRQTDPLGNCMRL